MNKPKVLSDSFYGIIHDTVSNTPSGDVASDAINTEINGEVVVWVIGSLGDRLGHR